MLEQVGQPLAIIWVGATTDFDIDRGGCFVGRGILYQQHLQPIIKDNGPICPGVGAGGMNDSGCRLQPQCRQQPEGPPGPTAHSQQEIVVTFFHGRPSLAGCKPGVGDYLVSMIRGNNRLPSYQRAQIRNLPANVYHRAKARSGW